ncbi:Uma2 family endonuclease [Dorea longicatena]|uniref:Uma2 family endonuclease n=3 Tax=Dorea longicatena TaxID=88431 RepID=A0A6L8S0N5_9FIRM|nr:Uma2 family endonuclease [Dorea longicatena]MZK32365.1 Uma2 family endonuclease [Dorea longicatena]MZK41112.1 Uma2 family endonuclease [Dorea longicatena]RYT32262.1 Uma2 family endonuclease [Dorea longicatena]
MKGSVSNPYPGMMKESVSAYRIYGDGTDHEGDIWKSFRGKKQGEYTLKEYEAIPDEYRVELIDGVIYDLNMPTTIHQQLAFEISIKLREYIRQNKGLCMVLPSPVSVQLDEDDRTMIQPDVVICCDREKILQSHVYGAPDMVIEILSPSTRKKDMGLKLKKYITARVREYWMVDPDKKKVVVYDLEHNELPAIYGFEDQVPVNIFAGKCQIDFSEICSYIEFLFEKE